jgi:hypothetical protein
MLINILLNHNRYIIMYTLFCWYFIINLFMLDLVSLLHKVLIQIIADKKNSNWVDDFFSFFDLRLEDFWDFYIIGSKQKSGTKGNFQNFRHDLMTKRNLNSIMI